MEAFGQPAGHLYTPQWKVPLFCAIFLHVIIFAGVFYAPEIFRTKPKFAKIQTVSLVNLAQPAASAKPAASGQRQPPARPPKKTATKKTPVKTESVAGKTVAAPVADNAPPKAISVNPQKRKIKKQIAEPQKTVDRRQEQLKKERAQRRARELAQKLKEEARREAQLEKQALLAEIRAKLAEQALEEERDLFTKTSEIDDIPPAPEPPSQPDSPQGAQSSSSGSSGIIGHQYYTTVGAIIQSHWVLPPNLENEADLQATLVIKINQSGRIIDMFFEKKSPNAMFNQFVTNSVNASNPLPPIPPALGLKEIEFEMFFSKEGVH